MKKYFVGGVLTVAMAGYVIAAPTLEASLAQDNPGKVALQKAQEKVDGIHRKGAEFVSQTLQLDRENRLLTHYKERLEKQIAQLVRQQQALQRQRQALRQVRLHVYPKMQRMQATLRELIQADLPFYQEERSLRLANLQEVMQDASLTDAQKMDFLLDAYQVEVSYGYTVASHEGRNEKGDLVTFLRIGRLAYFALEPRQQKAKYFSQGAWHDYTGDYAKLRQAANIAATREPLSLMMIDSSIWQTKEQSK